MLFRGNGNEYKVLLVKGGRNHLGEA